MNYKLINVCSLKDGNGGNLAGVCLDKLSSEEMQTLATKINVSETCFVKNIENLVNQTNIKITYYTPTNQVNFCGHGTIATLGYCAKFGLIKNQKINVVLENNQTIECFADKECIFIKESNYVCKEIDLDISACFSNLTTATKFFIVEQTSKDLFIRLNSTEDLYGLDPNFDEIIKVSKLLGISGFHFYVLQDKIFTRNFSPIDGINEESVTISASLGLALLLRQSNLLKNKITKIIQGSETVGYGEIEILQNNFLYVGGKYNLINFL